LTRKQLVYLIINKNKIKVMSNKKETKSAKRGRPIVNGSKRQAVLAMRQTKRDSGIEIKRGRPKGSAKKIEIEVETESAQPVVVA
jgi:hypothetical protein